MMYLFAIMAGGMVVLSMVMNARIARSLGVFQGALINFGVGLVTSLLLVAVSFVFGFLAIQDNVTAPSWYAYFGGVIAVGIVASCNVVIPKISVVYSAVLIFLGQILTGLLLDTLMAGRFDTHKALGALLVAGGLLVNARIDAQAEVVLSQGPPTGAGALPPVTCAGPGANG